MSQTATETTAAMPGTCSALWSLARDIGYTLQLVWQAAPRWNVLNLVLVVLQGLLPLVALYLMKNIVDVAAAGIAGGNMPLHVQHLLCWVALAAGVALLLVSCRSLAIFANEAQAQRVLEKFTSLIHTQSMAVDLTFYENAHDHNMMNRAQQDALFRPQAIFSTIIQLIQNGIAVLGIFGLLLSYNWALTLVITLIAIPGAVIGLAYGRKTHDLLTQQVEDERRCYYYNLVLTDPYPAKELRLFQLGPFFAELYRHIRERLRTERLHIFRGRAVYEGLAQGLATVSIFAALGYIGISTLEKVITVGAMVMYFQAFQSASTNLQAFLRSLTGLYEHSLFLEQIYQFLQVKPRIAAESPTHPVPDVSREGVRFFHVNFTYPGGEQPTLSDIDLELAPGQVIALVGENGSGKSTLIKLLCRLYDPNAGRIVLESLDIRHFDPAVWRQQVSVVFQDYMRYYLSVYDNIRLGDINQIHTMDAVHAAARAAGIDDKITRLPVGYQTMLGKQFTDGEELSGGEWQKMAIARAFMRQSRIIVLDEPSSALDPLAEAELFRNFRALIKGKSAILISHRFSTVQMADYIYVMAQGRIIERGSHQELLQSNGTYARLYRTQAAQYQ
jgi:ATP-binding cassette subfamily B protein